MGCVSLSVRVWEDSQGHLPGFLGSATFSSPRARLLSCTAMLRMDNGQGQPHSSKGIDPYSWAGRMLLERNSSQPRWARGQGTAKKIKHSPQDLGLFPTHVLRATWKGEKKISPLLRGYHWFGSRPLAKEAPTRISPDISDTN